MQQCASQCPDDEGLRRETAFQVLGVAFPFVKLKPDLDHRKASSQFRMKVMVIMMVERRVLMKIRLRNLEHCSA